MDYLTALPSQDNNEMAAASPTQRSGQGACKVLYRLSA
jgi:hypothetical protein